MISTQRLIIIMLMINVVVGIVDLTYYSPTQYQTTPFDSINNQLDAFQQKAQEEETTWGGLFSGAVNVLEVTVINPLRFGYTLLRFLWKAFIPFSILPTGNETPVENVVITVIILFRSLLALIMGIEIYLFFKNKKTT